MQYFRYIVGYSCVSYSSFIGYNYLDYKKILLAYDDEYYWRTPSHIHKINYIQKNINIYNNFIEAVIFPVTLPKKIIPYII